MLTSEYSYLLYSNLRLFLKLHCSFSSRVDTSLMLSTFPWAKNNVYTKEYFITFAILTNSKQLCCLKNSLWTVKFCCYPLSLCLPSPVPHTSSLMSSLLTRNTGAPLVAFLIEGSRVRFLLQWTQSKKPSF